VKSDEARIARLERILGPRSQKAALRFLADILVQAQREEDRQERSSRRRPPKVNPDEGGMPAGCEFEFRPPPSEKTAQPPPAYIAYMAAQAAEVQANPPPPVQPATRKTRRKSAKHTSAQHPSPVADMCVFPAHWQFNRSRRRDESEDEQRRRVPPLVI